MSNSLWPHGLHAAHQAPLSSTIFPSLLKLMYIESMMSSNHLILCQPLLLLSSIFPSIRVFSNESALHIRWPKYWSFSISPSNEDSCMISFRIGWFGLLAVQGTLKSLLHHHSSKASRTLLDAIPALFLLKLIEPHKVGAIITNFIDGETEAKKDSIISQSHTANSSRPEFYSRWSQSRILSLKHYT